MTAGNDETVIAGETRYKQSMKGTQICNILKIQSMRQWMVVNSDNKVFDDTSNTVTGEK